MFCSLPVPGMLELFGQAIAESVTEQVEFIPVELFDLWSPGEIRELNRSWNLTACLHIPGCATQVLFRIMYFIKSKWTLLLAPISPSPVVLNSLDTGRRLT